MELGNSPDCRSEETSDRKRLECQTTRRERWWTEVAPVRVLGTGGSLDLCIERSRCEGGDSNVEGAGELGKHSGRESCLR